MLSGPRSAIIIVLTALCPFTAYAKSKASGYDASTTVSAANAYATGAISGKVTRLDGMTAIAGSTVKVYQGTTVVGAATTNATGDYTVGTLASGTYSVQVSAIGYETTTQTGVSVTDGVTTTLNVSLPVPINYVYDDLGRLVAVIDKDGNAASYSYDAVGNLLGISRQIPTQAAIIQFSPGSGPVGTSVTIFGAGFSATASQNAVTFNGVAATVLASSTNLIVTSVPSGATTGTIGVTSPLGNASSTAAFTVTTTSAGTPTITGFTPTIGTPGTAVTINGTNFDTVASNDRSTFNTVSSTVTSASATAISTSVPIAGSGHISVTTPAGKATSSADFFIPPAPYATSAVLSTGRMTIGGSASNVSVNGAGKIALVLFDGTQGQRIYLDITNVSAPSNANVNIYNPDATLLVSIVVSFSNPSYIDAITLPATGTYTILFAPGGSVTTSATFTLYNVPPDFTSAITPGGSMVTATMTAAGQNARLTFNGSAGQIVSLKMTGVTIGSSTSVYVYNPNGTTLLSLIITISQGGWVDATTLPSTGTYTILVDPLKANTGSVTLALHNVVHIVGPIVPGGSAVTVTIGTPGQNASLTFSGTAGQQVSLNVTGVTVAGTVSIKKPDGTALASGNVASGVGVFIDNTTLPVAGTYTIFVDPTTFNTGSVTLTLYDVGDITGTIVPGGSPVTVTLTSPGQNARISFSGTAGQKISLRVTGVTIGNCILTIFKPDGAALTGGAQIAPGAFIDTQALATTGTYTILVNPATTFTGNAVLTLYDVPADTTGTITIGGAAVSVGTTVPGQNATVTFGGAAGQQVSLNMSGVTVAGGTVFLKKPDGTVIASASFGTGGAFIDNTTLPVAGTYTIFADPSTFNTGNMTLTLYDVADLTGTIVAGGSPVTVSLPIPGQNERLTFSGTVGQKVSLKVTGVTIGNCIVTLFKPDGTALIGVQIAPGAFIDTQTLAATGTYTILINPATTFTGNATLTLYDVPADATGTITIGGTAIGIGPTVPGQNAAVTFSATSGQQVTVHVTGNTISAVTVTLLKPDGTGLTGITTGSANFNLATQTLSVTGTYTISINPIGVNLGSMNVSVTSP
jgi:YD repeat-containing protein